MVQVKLGGVNVRHDYGKRINLSTLFELFAKSGPECAVLALEQLKNTCQDHRYEIRREAYLATPHFLQVLPEHEDVHSLCMDVMKDNVADVRRRFLNELAEVTFKPESMAANLAWTLTVEATRDDDVIVHLRAVDSVVHLYQTSAVSIEKTIEVLLELFPTGTDHNRGYGDRFFPLINKVLRECPAKLTLFMPLLAECCKDSGSTLCYEAARMSRDLSVFLPTPQLRELGEMISRIYWEVEDPSIRKTMVAILYDIGRKIPELIYDFRRVFSKDCGDADIEISELVEARETVIMITSTESVDAINEVFWDQSVRVRRELLRQIERENMINAETAETVLGMVENCMDSYYDDDDEEMFSVLSSAARFHSPSIEVFGRWLDYALTYENGEMLDPVFAQPLDIHLRYYWETADSRLRHHVAVLFATGSVTYKAGRDGRSIVSIIRKGKKTELEAPTALAEDVIGLARSFCASAFSEVPSSSRV